MTNTTIIHVGDVGTVFELTITEKNGTVVDVSSAETLVIHFQKPNKTKLARTAVLTTDGKDGKIQYTTVAGDIMSTGVWQFQGYAVFSASEKFSSEVAEFPVMPNIHGEL